MCTLYLLLHVHIHDLYIVSVDSITVPFSKLVWDGLDYFVLVFDNSATLLFFMI